LKSARFRAIRPKHLNVGGDRFMRVGFVRRLHCRIALNLVPATAATGLLTFRLNTTTRDCRGQSILTYKRARLCH
jgi:hypothetical protein